MPIPVARVLSLRWLSRSRGIAVAVLFAGIVALLYGAWHTRDSVADLRQAIASRQSGKSTSLIDLSPLQAAQRLASQASLPDELPLSTSALRLADHEVDQAFATALRDAANAAAPGKQQILAEQRVALLFAQVKDDQRNVDKLTAAVPQAKDQDDAEQDVELAQAKLALDQDDLQDAQEVLSRTGPDRHEQLEQALKQQQASEQKQAAPSATIPGLHTLKDRYDFWQILRGRRSDVQAAQQEAATAAGALLTERNRREADLQQRETATKSGARAATPPAAQSPTETQQAQPQEVPQQLQIPTLTRSQAIQQLKALAAERTTLTEFDRRITDMRALAANYDKWQALLLSRQRLEIHYMLRSLAGVLLIVVLAIVADAAIRRYFITLPVDRSRLRNLRVLALATVQTLAFLAVLVVVFGKPAQIYTFLGLVGAGLAVALKDFILAFLGWFFLMGEHGLRIGDWVEIEGVAGEVVEVGLLRTVLFETGNWTDSGHPTGRRVAFFNTFAVAGHFFNFSTQGQWLWDEIRIPLPATADAYAQLKQMEPIVIAASAPSVQIAEREWRGLTSRYGVQHFSADPTIEMRPTAAGMEVVVRYITRAQNRTTDRAALYDQILQALRIPPGQPAAAAK